MEFKKVAEAVEVIKTFCKENDYSAKKDGCLKCPFMLSEEGYCIFRSGEVPTSWEVKNENIVLKFEED